MNNVFKNKDNIKMEVTYDLKGSSYQWLTSQKKIMKGASRKDNNFRKDNN